MNNKRDHIARIEEVYEVQITLQIRPDLDIPHYRIERQWSENNQQRVEVLEDTSKRIKPPRNAKKLKPVKPIVGIPTPAPTPAIEEEKKTSPLKSLIGFLTGQKKKKPVEQKAVPVEEPQKQQERPKRRRRSGNKNRPRATGQKSTAAKTTSDKELQQNNKKQKQVKVKETTAANKNNADAASGEVKKRRRRRRRRRPAAANNGAAAPTQDQKMQETAPKSPAPENTAKSE